jgi:hypothetical protein
MNIKMSININLNINMNMNILFIFNIFKKLCIHILYSYSVKKRYE